MPSSIPGMTVDEYLKEEMERSREAGRLFEAEGWDVKPQGSEDDFIISFTYEEKDNQQKRAEWRVNIKSNSFQAQNELAKMVYNRQTP